MTLPVYELAARRRQFIPFLIFLIPRYPVLFPTLSSTHFLPRFDCTCPVLCSVAITQSLQHTTQPRRTRVYHCSHLHLHAPAPGSDDSRGPIICSRIVFCCGSSQTVKIVADSSLLGPLARLPTHSHANSTRVAALHPALALHGRI